MPVTLISPNASHTSFKKNTTAAPPYKPAIKSQLKFKGEQKYENPVNKGWEFFSASAGPLFISALVAAGTWAVTNAMQLKKASKIALPIAAAAATLAFTLPSKLYHTNVRTFVKKKEMDVFSRSKSVETNLAEQIDTQARNNEVPLEKSIDNYMKFQIGKNGSGLGIVNSQAS